MVEVLLACMYILFKNSLLDIIRCVKRKTNDIFNHAYITTIYSIVSPKSAIGKGKYYWIKLELSNWVKLKI